MLKVYPAIFHKEDGYWVEFPDLVGCQSCGNIIEETIEMAEEALGLYLADCVENKKALPKSSDISALSVTDGFINYIGVDVDKYRRNTKAVKKTLSIPAWLAEEAEKNHVSLSRVLQDGLKEKFGY